MVTDGHASFFNINSVDGFMFTDTPLFLRLPLAVSLSRKPLFFSILFHSIDGFMVTETPLFLRLHFHGLASCFFTVFPLTVSCSQTGLSLCSIRFRLRLHLYGYTPLFFCLPPLTVSSWQIHAFFRSYFVDGFIFTDTHTPLFFHPSSFDGFIFQGTRLILPLPPFLLFLSCRWTASFLFRTTKRGTSS